ncbi:hypothetical protein [Kaistella carnis]|uniref:Uncharacterized protein n=1 Tax=Kaistella carnis TaxID=1241979 RepID=A0A3G8XHI2_9FLAO|nr:hypothetical protein [Kaistella carnis]AZI32945.1 hypothetical protein EIB73_07060 [Kaistella carnis]
MNYIYAIAHEEKEALEKAKRYVGIAALPFAISGGVFVKALQSSVALVSYFCDIDSTFRLSDNLFKFKGPVVISDVYWKNWRNYMTTDDNWDKKWQTPTLDPAYDSNDLGSKKDALEKFENLKTIFNFK